MGIRRTKIRWTQLALLAPTLWGAGCANRDEGPRVELDLTHYDLVSPDAQPHPGEPPREVEAIATPSGIRVRGAVVLPDPCDRVEADVEPSGQKLRLRIHVVGSPSHREECGLMKWQQVVQYDADIEGLVAGDYSLEVRHDFSRSSKRVSTGERASSVQLHRTVRVPGPGALRRPESLIAHTESARTGEWEGW